MAFGIGGGSARSTSTSESQSTAQGFSFGESTSRSEQESGSTARATSTGRSTQDIAFADFFQQLYGDSLGAAGRTSLGLPEFTSQAQSLFGAGKGFLDEIGGDAGSRFLEETITGGSGILDEQISLLSEDVSHFFNEELLPGVTDQSIRAGQKGGGREGVATGKAIELAGREFRRGASDLRVADRERRGAAARDLAGLSIQGQQTGLNALPGVLGLAEAGTFADLSVQERLAGIFGGPTALTTSEQSSESTSDAFSIAEALAEQFNIAFDTAQSTSESQASSKSKSFNFGL